MEELPSLTAAKKLLPLRHLPAGRQGFLITPLKKLLHF